MTEAEIRVRGRLWLPSLEAVTLEFTDGETYKSRKFKRIIGVASSGLLSATTTTDTMNVSIGTSDSTTITLRASSAATTHKATLLIWGVN